MASRFSKYFRRTIFSLLCTCILFFCATAHAEDRTTLRLYVPDNQSTQERQVQNETVATGDAETDWISTALAASSIAVLLFLCNTPRKKDLSA